MRHKKIFRRRLITPHRVWRLKRALRKPSVRIFLAFLFLLGLGVVIGILLVPPEAVVVQEPMAAPAPQKEIVVEHQTVEDRYKISARDAILLGRYGNALDIGGDYARKIPGSVIQVNLRPGDDVGVIEAVLPDVKLNTEDAAMLDGEVKIVINRLAPFEEWQEEGVLLDQELFGDTGKGFDVLPRTRALLAAFGQADILLDDQEVYDNLHAILFYSEGMRNDDHAIARGDRLYATKYDDEVFTDPTDRELHLLVYSDIEDKKNFPPKSVFVSLYFEDPHVLSLPEGAKK